jgi:hypothetical protein
MLVLLIEGTEEVCRLDDFTWYNKRTKINEYWRKPSNNIKVSPQQFERL